MSKSTLSMQEEVSPESQDIFSDFETITETNDVEISQDSSSTSGGTTLEPEPADDTPEWKGVCMDEIRKGLELYEQHELPPICPSADHTVLIWLPLPPHGPPKPYPANSMDKWSQGYVRMPHSSHSLYPTTIEESGSQRCRNRWEVIQEALLQIFVSSQQLETAILSYNQAYAQRWNFVALHQFFSEVIDEAERQMFFESLLPKMIQLALQLPELVTGPIPLLKRHQNSCISLSQLQVASLLANAFFCTFPRRNSTNPQSEYAMYPHINFNRLFAAWRRDKQHRNKSVMEKYKCIFHYFRRVTSKAPEGVITIERRYVPREECPRWDSIHEKLPPLHVTSKGMIENEGAGSLQVDFANKYLGGGVLSFGCVQEEIRFVICPELMVTMLITEALDDTEAVVISGVERYSKYKGYSSNFEWDGDFIDETPRDNSGRRMTSIVAIDALHFKNPVVQFSPSNMIRELNKAYVGFVGSKHHKENLPPVATGNWGCGAFRGNPKLKVLLQLMAAAVAGRSLVYYTFGDAILRDDIADMYWNLIENDTNVGRLFLVLSNYKGCTSNNHLDFYQFLYKKIKMKSLTDYFNRNTENQSTSTNESSCRPLQKKISPKKKREENIRKFYSSVKEKQRLEKKRGEERIENPLGHSSKDENMDIVEISLRNCQKEDRENCVENEIKNYNFEDEQNDQDEKHVNVEKKKKLSVIRLLKEEKEEFDNQVYNLNISGLEALETLEKSEVIDDANHKCNKFASNSKSSSYVVTNKENGNTSDCKYTCDTSNKKTVQKKISDFFTSI